MTNAELAEALQELSGWMKKYNVSMEPKIRDKGCDFVVFRFHGDGIDLRAIHQQPVWLIATDKDIDSEIERIKRLEAIEKEQRNEQ